MNNIPWKNVVLFVFGGVFLCIGFFVMLWNVEEEDDKEEVVVVVEESSDDKVEKEEKDEGIDDMKEEEVKQNTQEEQEQVQEQAQAQAQEEVKVQKVQVPDPDVVENVLPKSHKKYSSCQEAIDAGEKRIQGSKGKGKGFPAELVEARMEIRMGLFVKNRCKLYTGLYFKKYIV